MEHTSDGSQIVYNVPFPYINRAYVHVFVTDPDTHEQTETPFVWQTPGTIQLSAPVPFGWVVRIQRTTPEDKALVAFSDESYVQMKHLDLGFLQMLHLIQESDDASRSDALFREELEQVKNDLQEQIDNLEPDIELDIATADTLGVVRVDGATVHVDEDGVLRTARIAAADPFFSYVEEDEAMYLNATASATESDHYIVSGSTLLLRGEAEQ